MHNKEEPQSKIAVAGSTRPDLKVWPCLLKWQRKPTARTHIHNFHPFHYSCNLSGFGHTLHILKSSGSHLDVGYQRGYVSLTSCIFNIVCCLGSYPSACILCLLLLLVCLVWGGERWQGFCWHVMDDICMLLIMASLSHIIAENHFLTCFTDNYIYNKFSSTCMYIYVYI